MDVKRWSGSKKWGALTIVVFGVDIVFGEEALGRIICDVMSQHMRDIPGSTPALVAGPMRGDRQTAQHQIRRRPDPDRHRRAQHQRTGPSDQENYGVVNGCAHEHEAG
jgi:hypothetical protein